MPHARLGFTTRAICLLAAGVTAALCGTAFGEIDLVRAGLLAMAIPCVAAVLVRRSQVRIANRRRVDPAQAQAGAPVTISLTVANRSALRTGSLMLEDALPEQVAGRARFVLDPLGGGESRTVTYRLPGLGRGRYRVGPLRVRLGDPFGMVDLTRSFTETGELVVAPVVDALPAVAPPRSDGVGDNAGSRSVGVHGADDQSTRDYRTGDDLRKIHWRSSARRGALMVRQEERPWQGHITLLLDTRASAHVTCDERAGGADPRAHSSFEWAVSAAASIGTHVVHAGRRLTLITGPGPAGTSGVGDAPALISPLAELRPASSGDLAPVAGLVRATDRDSTVIAVLGRLDPLSLDALARAAARGRSAPAYALLLDVDSWSRAGARPQQPDLQRSSTGAAQLLRAAGWRVVVVDHASTTAQAWHLLLAGMSAGERRTATAR